MFTWTQELSALSASRTSVDLPLNPAWTYDLCVLVGVSWLCGNAECLPVADNTYDAYTISFGIRNVTHIDKVCVAVWLRRFLHFLHMRNYYTALKVCARTTMSIPLCSIVCLASASYLDVLYGCSAINCCHANLWPTIDVLAGNIGGIQSAEARRQVPMSRVQ